jgi:hypothetical protein
MAWHEEPNHPFAGIAEKLKRSHENIKNLNVEIDGFFKACKYPVIPNANSEGWQEAVDYHSNLVIPLYCSVLSGEIVHHLRSCLDHIVWHFSSAEYRLKSENSIEFPVFREKPIAKDELARYERKAKGITNPKVASLIADMQPYQRGSDAEDDPICIVHDLDRFDKHRELAIVSSCATVFIPPGTSIDAVRAIVKQREGEAVTDAERELARRTINQDCKVLPQVAFAKFGKRKNQLVIPSLLQLHNIVMGSIDLFEREI